MLRVTSSMAKGFQVLLPPYLYSSATGLPRNPTATPFCTCVDPTPTSSSSSSSSFFFGDLLEKKMLLGAISAVSRPSSRGSSNLVFLQDLTNPNAISTVPSVCLNPFTSSLSPSSLSLSLAKRRDKGFATSASNDTASLPLTGVVFQPFEEVKKDEFMVPRAPLDSLARQRYSKECENAINEQINVEYSVSYVYHSLYAYFDRDNVAQKGLAKFFKEASEEEREHAEKLMKYQNKRGGKVIMYHVKLPPTEFDHIEKGDALYAMELTLSLEKLINEKLLKVHGVANENNDPQMTDFIESEFLGEQVEAIKKIAEYVAQLRRVGKGHGVWHFDQMLLN